jgi:hypothetical protein
LDLTSSFPRFIQHPAYTGKLCSFFLISVPFVNGVQDVLRWSLLIGVYYWRAQTEEAHLRSVGLEYGIYEQELAERWQRWGAMLDRDVPPPADRAADDKKPLLAPGGGGDGDGVGDDGYVSDRHV